MTLYGEELAKQIMEENYRMQMKNRTVVKLPCCGDAIEIQKTGDQMLYCAKCNKRALLTWGQAKKVYTND